MLIAVTSLTLIATCLGLILGIAARRFHVEPPELVSELEAMLPGSQCGQCGFPGCNGAAEALADGLAPVTLCPPGGPALALALADKLGVQVELGAMGEREPTIAAVREDICIGCTKCFKECPTDAIHGAMKQMHSVMKEACTGCGKCAEICPTEAVTLVPVAATLGNWRWREPAFA
ncbi:MAG: RnfABCDGE type electron transport complex subunit B [Rhodocyclaceae bacterium]|nr:RnfABCDGE type electron transport complex subunit B [Rhodocyclaceae bacterium]